jgi:hypothetical protein
MTRTHSLPGGAGAKNRPPKGKGGQGSEVLDKGWCRHERRLNDSESCWARHCDFSRIRDGIGGRTSTSVGFATPNEGLVCSGVVSWSRN